MKTMSFESDGAGNEIWTCDTCGYSLFLAGEGGDVAECPECLRREYAEEAARENDMFCCICGQPITSTAIEDAEKDDNGTWVHQKCAQDQ